MPKLERLARSVPDARAIGDSLAACWVRLLLGGSVYDPNDPMGKCFFNILATFAEFEVDLLRMRTREGMAIARAKGRLKGKRPSSAPPNGPFCSSSTLPATTRSPSSPNCSQSAAPRCTANWLERTANRHRTALPNACGERSTIGRLRAVSEAARRNHASVPQSKDRRTAGTRDLVAGSIPKQSRVERVACSTWLLLSARRRPVPVLAGRCTSGRHGGAETRRSLRRIRGLRDPASPREREHELRLGRSAGACSGSPVGRRPRSPRSLRIPLSQALFARRGVLSSFRR